MTRKIFYTILIGILFSLIPSAVLSLEKISVGGYTAQEFKDYWYTRGAEISRFSLKQARYGEIHKGDAVLIFVTEKMNPHVQVKADHPGPADIPMLKLNAVRKFFTGIYPYSIMTSVFSPVDAQKYPLPLKISSSTQEWCGNVYFQMNLRDNEYHVRHHSYFEKEGDQNFRLGKYMPEDALWTMIRLAPAKLPQGEFFLIPGTTYSRFIHRKPKPQKVSGKLTKAQGKSPEGNPLLSYALRFTTEKRTLRIWFEKNFPYRIQKWEDRSSAPKWMGGKVLTTKATRTHSLMISYWNHHGEEDRALLQKLGLGSREMAVY